MEKSASHAIVVIILIRNCHEPIFAFGHVCHPHFRNELILTLHRGTSLRVTAPSRYTWPSSKCTGDRQGKRQRARKVRLSSLIYIFHPKSIAPRIQILAGQSATHPGLLIFFSLGHHFVEIVSTIRSFRLTYRGQLIRHGWKSQLLSDYLCKTGGNPRRSIDRCLPGFIIAGHLVNFKSSRNFYKETLDYCATCALSDFVCRIRSANESQLNFT